MSDAPGGVILFHSSNHAIWAVNVLKAAGIATRLIPTPKQLSSEYSHAMTLAAREREPALAALDARGVPFDRYADLPA